MTIWFTSDTHWNHANSIIYDDRPFRDINHMNEELIYRWNSVVKKDDTIYHLGDFCFGTWKMAGDLLDVLNGHKHLIWGNHDPHKIRRMPHWVSSQYATEVNLQGVNITLCHYSMMVWNRSQYGSLMLHGHSHGHIAGDSQRLDVGCMNWDYYPVSLKQIQERLSTNPERILVDHHGMTDR
jgi:calcineurin-like phosphoesterase family protein